MSDDFRHLLLEDYKQIRDAFWKYEQSGETRVNLFIGLVTFGLGGIATLLTTDTQNYAQHLKIAALGGLIGLLLIGGITLLRIIARNANTDQTKYQLDLIRQTFMDHFDRDGDYFDYDLFPKPGRSRRKFGGLAHTVAAVNALLCVAIFAFILNITAKTGAAVPEFIAPSLALFVSIFALQVGYAHRQEKHASSKLPELFDAPTHAGGVVYDLVKKKPRYLLVTAKLDEGEWVLPKGHIDGGERPRDAAVREVREEAHIIAKPVAYIGSREYSLASNPKPLKIRFYLMKKVDEITPSGLSDEKRKICWLTRDEAIDALKFSESKSLIRRAAEIISKRKLNV